MKFRAENIPFFISPVYPVPPIRIIFFVKRNEVTPILKVATFQIDFLAHQNRLPLSVLIFKKTFNS